MILFKVTDLNERYIEYHRLAGTVGSRAFESYKVGTYKGFLAEHDVFDFGQYMVDHGYQLFSSVPSHPYYLHNEINSIIEPWREKNVVGYYITSSRYVQRVYHFEDLLKKNKLCWVTEKEYNQHRFSTYYNESEVSLFPKKVQSMLYVKLYGYKKNSMGKVGKVYKITERFKQEMMIEKEQLKSTDHVCHLIDVPVLKRYVLENRLKSQVLLRIKGIVAENYVIFDTCEETWHPIRLKLLLQPPEYTTPYEETISPKIN